MLLLVLCLLTLVSIAALVVLAQGTVCSMLCGLCCALFLCVGCFVTVMGNLSRCELHRHRVLDQLIEADVLVNRSSLKAWLPECTRRQADPTDPNGASYKSTQCIPGAKTCFCVNETSGEELDSSRYTQGGTPINCTLLSKKITTRSKSFHLP